MTRHLARISLIAGLLAAFTARAQDAPKRTKLPAPYPSLAEALTRLVEEAGHAGIGVDASVPVLLFEEIDGSSYQLVVKAASVQRPNETREWQRWQPGIPGLRGNFGQRFGWDTAPARVRRGGAAASQASVLYDAETGEVRAQHANVVRQRMHSRSESGSLTTYSRSYERSWSSESGKRSGWTQGGREDDPQEPKLPELEPFPSARVYLFESEEATPRLEKGRVVQVGELDDGTHFAVVRK